jgi:SAM-dependent methyltransferase
MTQCCGDLVYQGLCVRGRRVEVMDCVLCGFKHLHPKPTEEEMAEYYRSVYFNMDKPDYARTSGTESEYQFLVDEEKIRAGRPNLEAVGLVSSVLDFGCGPSAPFLKHWVRLLGYKGFAFYGVEPTVTAARGWSDYELGGCTATVYPSLEAGFSKTTKFDVIHLGFVLEHITNPHEILFGLKNRLKDGGKLIIEVPNDFNPLQLALWSKLAGTPWWVSSPDHTCYWSFKSLCDVLHRTGFSVYDCGTTYPVELFLAHGQDFRTDPEAKKAIVERRADLQRLWQKWPNPNLKIGRTVWVVAREVPTCKS